MSVGVLALQGAFIEHEKMVQNLGYSCKEIRQLSDLKGVDRLILPGGESTTQKKLLRDLGLYDPIREMILGDVPTLATCAGMILLAEEIVGGEETGFASLPVTVRRNAYGRQLGSFQRTASFGEVGEYPMIFIRAPYVEKTKDSVSVLARVDEKIVAVEYKNQLALAFHPELSADSRIHEKFLAMR